MKLSRISFALVATCAVMASLFEAQQAMAIDRYWQGDVSSVYTLNTNWSGGAAAPRATQGERAVIGTDVPLSGGTPGVGGYASSDAAPFGSPTLSAAAQNPGGLALGIRQFDYDALCEGDFCNPAPAAGALKGKLTINSGGSLNVILGSGNSPNIGANGKILLGVSEQNLHQGRGFITMNGGSLAGLAMTVGGEMFTGDADGLSHLRLNGQTNNVTVNIANAGDPTSAVAIFGRDLTVTGPNVNFNSAGIIFESTSTFNTAITSSTAHSPLKTSGNVLLDGNLFVQYSGGTLDIDETWDLFDFAGGLVGNFDNLGENNSVQITGVPAVEYGDGEVYRLRRTDGGVHGKRLQVIHQALYVLEVNQDTGEMTITNPAGGDIELDSYSISSPSAGSLLTSYKGISGGPPADTGWNKAGLSQFLLSEYKTEGSFSPAGDVSLGEEDDGEQGFDKFAVNNTLDIGQHGRDLIFTYGVPSASGDPGDPGDLLIGQVVYTGTNYEHNLVLRVNPATGEAEIHNDSNIALSFDGYSIVSDVGDLDAAGWDGLNETYGNDWNQSVSATTGALNETNLFDSVTLAPDQAVGIGTIADPGEFASLAAQDGLVMKFGRTDVGSGAPVGDYNEDGKVSAADFTIWRANIGAATLPNRDPNNAGTIGNDDFESWKANYGSTGSTTDETTFRLAAVQFGSLLSGSGAGSVAFSVAVPEPNSAILMFVGLGASLFLGRNRSLSKRRQPVPVSTVPGTSRHLGVSNMSRRCGFSLSILVGVCLVLANTLPAFATTQGIPLTNMDFELPGPVGVKTYAYDLTGTPIVGAIPGWTFPGLGVEDFGHPERLGDSGTEGDGNPGNEMILSMNDGIAYQVSSFVIQSIPATQQYVFSMDVHDIFTVDVNEEQIDDSCQLTVRFTYGPTRQELDTFVIDPTGISTRYEYIIESGSALLAEPYLGEVIGIEFETTSELRNAAADKSWAGIDNVIMQIVGTEEGDLNGDGDVDPDDYAILRDNLEESHAFVAEGELTGDYVVDLDDFRAFKTIFQAQGSGAGGSAPAGNSSAGGGPGVPEPSTFILAAIVAAIFGSSFFRKKSASLNRVLLIAVVVMGAALATATPASAELYYYDPFLLVDSPYGSNPAAVEPGKGEYTHFTVESPTFIAGQNPTMPAAPQPPFGTQPSYFSGAWETPGGDMVNGIVQQTGLSYIGAPADGGSYTTATEGLLDPGGNGRTGRYLDTEWDDTTDETIYLSFLANFGTIQGGDGGMGYRSVEFWPAGSTVGIDDGRMDIGYNQFFSSLGSPQQNPNTARIQWVVPGTGGGTVILPDSPLSYVEDGINHLIVLRFDLSPDPLSDTVRLYLDPVSLVEPDIPSASFSGVDYTMTAMGGMSRFGGGFNVGGNTNGSVDEIRVGSTFFDVMPELPYPGDTDGDDDADLDDLLIITTNWGMTVDGGPEDGDVANPFGRQGSDNFVGIADFRLWKDWRNCPLATCNDGAGAGGIAAGGPGIPEPSSLILALVAAAAMAGCGRAR